MLKIEHIGIAVKDFTTAIPLYEKLLNTSCYKTEIVQSQQVHTAFFKIGDNKIELLQSLTPDGVIAKFIEKKGEGIHHIAYDVTNIHAEAERLLQQGFTLITPTAIVGADNKLVLFLHPKDAAGVLTELCMEIK